MKKIYILIVTSALSISIVGYIAKNILSSDSIVEKDEFQLYDFELSDINGHVISKDDIVTKYKNITFIYICSHSYGCGIKLPMINILNILEYHATRQIHDAFIFLFNSKPRLSIEEQIIESGIKGLYFLYGKKSYKIHLYFEKYIEKQKIQELNHNENEKQNNYLSYYLNLYTIFIDKDSKTIKNLQYSYIDISKNIDIIKYLEEINKKYNTKIDYNSIQYIYTM